MFPSPKLPILLRFFDVPYPCLRKNFNPERNIMQSTLTEVIWSRSRESIAIQGFLAIVGTLLLALSAKIQVPFWPVPMTMQTFVVLVLGLMYGPKLGTVTGLLYLAEGAVGLPVFASGAGLAYLVGPTGGYLVGFVIAMLVMGLLASRGLERKVLTAMVAMFIGEVIIFALGVGWLATFIGMDKAIAGGLIPFLTAEGFKIALAAVTLPLVWRQLEQFKR